MIPLPVGEVRLHDARRSTHTDVTLESFSLARTPVTGADGERPWSGVTWFAAIHWCNLASAAAGLPHAYVVERRTVRWDVSSTGYRLPTAAEWEFACRAGTGGPTYGDLADDVDGPQPVGRKVPNGFGLHDMLGNVWEWCWDYADPARYGEYRSLRGGGWADASWHVRVSARRDLVQHWRRFLDGPERYLRHLG
ncbi:SUMF1/EgtB/PvdO family nonheme iron enzyme [Tersicoccus sp. Bi-70]|uniref:formylglycine-generating enzyme family protein n=1 Tax=Tersicoccus sp. Bi-70 TaxID=1897634 RepID=UPI0009777CBA|nr:SUMF1/EgtB/PvdO family nonheme iron enzyme [Tersicoccus sp. Bi-70]OMH31214.1 hypothetical protein BGP79_09180 [Tersicoccus sp. Bi-70]